MISFKIRDKFFDMTILEYGLNFIKHPPEILVFMESYRFGLIYVKIFISVDDRTDSKHLF